MLEISRKPRTAGSVRVLCCFWVVPPFLGFRGAALSTQPPWRISPGSVRQVSLLESEAPLAALAGPDDHEAPALSHPLLTLTVVSSSRFLSSLFSHHGDPVPRQWAASVRLLCAVKWLQRDGLLEQSEESSGDGRVLSEQWIVYKWIWKLFI